MDNYAQLVNKAFKNTLSQKSICLLGLVQVFCLSLILINVDPVWWLFAPRVLWLLVLIAAFSLSTVALWLKVKAFEAGANLQITLNLYLKLSSRVSLLIILSIFMTIVLKLLHVHWTLFAVASSLLAACLSVVMLASVLFNLSLIRSLMFMVDFLNRKLSVICGVAFIIILANTYGFYLAHTLFDNGALVGGFSVLEASATIWIVFLGLAVVAAFFSGIINAFAVLLFLEITKAKKTPEEIEAPVIQVAVN